MSLYSAMVLGAILLLVPGIFFLLVPRWASRCTRKNLRSRGLTLLIFGSATLWFLWHIATLGESDFGEYKYLLLALFGAVAIICYFHVEDFLLVRGAAALTLLTANVLLDAAYLHPYRGRLVLVVMVYASILAALYYGAVPFRLRDLLERWERLPSRARLFGLIGTTYGALLLLTAKLL